MRETPIAAAVRWQQLELVQQAFPSFVGFLEVVMVELGFHATEIQKDIGEFLAFGPQYLMIQAQRGQAKTTVTAAFAVFCLIHNPSFRVLILSAGGKQANEISTLIVRIITGMSELECLRPDKSAGDRTSTEAFDVHHSLKGLDKSPSVRCEGVESNLQGARADLLIADDVESGKNSKTEHLREQLLQITKDFTSICADGRIVYLGTPQSENSIYNTLPGRGYTLRIWPGRYPTFEQDDNYGIHIAPLIKRRMEADPSLRTGGGVDGKHGKPTDPELPAGREIKLQHKELDQGAAYFQLQHMLNTKLADAERYPLRTQRIVAMTLPGNGQYPMSITPSLMPGDWLAFNSCGKRYDFLRPVTLSDDRSALQSITMSIDPAGGGKNGDETGYAVVGFLNGNIWVLDVGGVPGGHTDDKFEALAEVALKWKPNKIIVEKNMGFGTWTALFLPVLRRIYKTANDPTGGCAVEEVFESGQKELRIIDTLEPIIGRHQLIMNAELIASDDDSVQKYSAAKRITYSLLNQLSVISRDKDCLGHDDRIDALATAVRPYAVSLAVEQTKAIEAKRRAEILAMQANPLNLPKHLLAPSRGAGNNLFNRRK